MLHEIRFYTVGKREDLFVPRLHVGSDEGMRLVVSVRSVAVFQGLLLLLQRSLDFRFKQESQDVTFKWGKCSVQLMSYEQWNNIPHYT